MRLYSHPEDLHGKVRKWFEPAPIHKLQALDKETGNTIMHPIWLLAFVTFVLVAGFLIWTRISTSRHRFGRNPEGLGGENDPLSGATDKVRDPDTLRASLDSGDRPVTR